MEIKLWWLDRSYIDIINLQYTCTSISDMCKLNKCSWREAASEPSLMFLCTDSVSLWNCYIACFILFCSNCWLLIFILIMFCLIWLTSQYNRAHTWIVNFIFNKKFKFSLNNYPISLLANTPHSISWQINNKVLTPNQTHKTTTKINYHYFSITILEGYVNPSAIFCIIWTSPTKMWRHQGRMMRRIIKKILFMIIFSILVYQSSRINN